MADIIQKMVDGGPYIRHWGLIVMFREFVEPVEYVEWAVLRIERREELRLSKEACIERSDVVRTRLSMGDDSASGSSPPGLAVGPKNRGLKEKPA